MLFVQKITQSEGRMALRMHGLKQPANMNLETEYVVFLSRGRAGPAAPSVLLLQQVRWKSREKV